MSLQRGLHCLIPTVYIHTVNPTAYSGTGSGIEHQFCYIVAGLQASDSIFELEIGKRNGTQTIGLPYMIDGRSSGRQRLDVSHSTAHFQFTIPCKYSLCVCVMYHSAMNNI